VMQDIMISGNVISANSADTQDAATPGPTGINVLGVSPITGLVISNNVIQDEAISIAINTSGIVQVHMNNLDESSIGIDNLGSGTITATQNWWGCAGGTGTKGCATVSGSGVSSSAPLQRQMCARSIRKNAGLLTAPAGGTPAIPPSSQASIAAEVARCSAVSSVVEDRNVVKAAPTQAYIARILGRMWDRHDQRPGPDDIRATSRGPIARGGEIRSHRGR
jgi:hypothetical protein